MIPEVAQEELIESELRYRRLFNTARDGILIVDFTTSLIIDVNPFLLELLGYSREEILEIRSGISGGSKTENCPRMLSSRSRRSTTFAMKICRSKPKAASPKQSRLSVTSMVKATERSYSATFVISVSGNRQSGRPSSYYGRGNWRPLASSPAAWPMTSTICFK